MVYSCPADEGVAEACTIRPKDGSESIAGVSITPHMSVAFPETKVVNDPVTGRVLATPIAEPFEVNCTVTAAEPEDTPVVQLTVSVT
jgi:hypothetical protein